MRILMSFLAVPGPADRDEQALRRLLRQMLLPAILQDGARGTGEAQAGGGARGGGSMCRMTRPPAPGMQFRP